MNTRISRCLTAMCVLLIFGCSSYRQPAQHPDMPGAPVAVDRTSMGYDRGNEVSSRLLVPNGSGGTMMIPGESVSSPNPHTEEAFELKLKTRELAAQLFETRDNSPLLGLVAMPTSFVDLNNFEESTPLGRYLSESMFYECNQRDFPVREYRLRGNIQLREGTGELSLSRDLKAISTSQSWSALLIGTYLRDESAVFVNARLVRPSDGMVLRSAHMVLPLNSLTNRMSTTPPKPPFESGTLRITSR